MAAFPAARTRHHGGVPLAVIAGAVVFASACAGGSTGGGTIDAGAPGSTASPPSDRAANPTGSGTSTVGTTPSGSVPPDSAAPPPSEGGSSTTAGLAVGLTTSTAAPTSGPGQQPTTSAPARTPTTPGPPPPPTTVPPPTTTTTVKPPAPSLQAGGPKNDLTVHCMGGVVSAQASPTWTTSGATAVAIAVGRVADAFAAPYNPNPLPLNGSYPVPVSCTGGDTQETTVSAKGPGGTVTKLITWQIHRD